jgi:hypothetical protein
MFEWGREPNNQRTMTTLATFTTPMMAFFLYSRSTLMVFRQRTLPKSSWRNCLCRIVQPTLVNPLNRVLHHIRNRVLALSP